MRCCYIYMFIISMKSHQKSVVNSRLLLPVDQQKMKGYILKWCDARMLLRYYMYM